MRLLLISFILLFKSFALGQTTQPTDFKTFTILINSKGTYLSPPKCFNDGTFCDIHQAPTSFSLVPLFTDPEVFLAPGDLIGLEAIGTFDPDGFCNPGSIPGCAYGENYGGLLSVFAGDSGLLYAGPGGTNQPIVSVINDRPQDFYVPSYQTIWAEVPIGANRLLFSADDLFFRACPHLIG